MYRISTSLAALTAVLCLTACGHGHGQDDHAQPGHETGHESHASEAQLTLDGGKKWQVDDSTRASAARLAGLLEDADPALTLDGARALGQALDEELDVLVKGCKMTGPAHDQLHVFLVALFPQVEALRQETDPAALERARDEVGSLLAAYDRHFE